MIGRHASRNGEEAWAAACTPHLSPLAQASRECAALLNSIHSSIPARLHHTEASSATLQTTLDTEL